jgi:uncharacterized membrane protein
MTLHLLTLAWAATLLPPAWQQGRRLQVLAAGLGFTILCEMAWFTVQAARGQPAHYLEGSSLESVAYHVITGGGATVMMLATSLLGWWIWRHARAEVAPALRWAAALGLGLTGVLTIATAFPMAMELLGTGHSVGGIADGRCGLPVVGWSTQMGDLRVPHFFATHLAQALPLLALVALAWRPTVGHQVVSWGAVLGVAVVILTFVQAALGHPLLNLGCA